MALAILRLSSLKFRPNHFKNVGLSLCKYQLPGTSLCSNVYSTKPPESPLTVRQKLKKAVADYGSTVIVFHVGISLVSLGVCYLLVSSGLDVEKFMTFIGLSDERATKIATSAGTFAVSYAVHKVFAPARIMVTLTVTPLIVRHLRRIGILKK